MSALLRSPLTRTMYLRWQSIPSDLRLFIGALCLFSIGGSIVDPAFNNYVRDTFKLAADTRGTLEFPRELPGFLVMVTSGLLFFLPEVRTASVAMAAAALGIAGLAFAGSSFPMMIGFMMLWSAGMHLLQPMRNSIILDFAKRNEQASMLGKVGSITTMAVIVGASVSWLIFTFLPKTSTTYNAAFMLASIVTGLGALLILRMKPAKHQGGARPKLVFNWNYRVYYGLSILFGARKQVFITFAPWVLITVFHRGPATFAALSVLAAITGIFWQPLIGKLIDRFGERVVLMTDGIALFAICIGYGFAPGLGDSWYVMAIVLVCFVLDQLFFAVGMARVTYLNKIAARKEDVTASLSMGVTLDHAVSMSIPILGGATWMAFGFEYVFLGAGVIALSSTLVASMIKIPKPPVEDLEIADVEHTVEAVGQAHDGHDLRRKDRNTEA
jgi:MFS family permease